MGPFKVPTVQRREKGFSLPVEYSLNHFSVLHSLYVIISFFCNNNLLQVIMVYTFFYSEGQNRRRVVLSKVRSWPWKLFELRARTFFFQLLSQLTMYTKSWSQQGINSSPLLNVYTNFHSWLVDIFTGTVSADIRQCTNNHVH